MFDSGLLIFAWFVIAVLHESRRIKAKLFFFSPDLLPLLWSCSQLIFFLCMFLIADSIHEQNRPFSRKDFTLWATSEVVPATVQR